MLNQYFKKKTIKIKDKDEVQIRGIFVGINYRTNKYIIQLVKPEFMKSPNETLPNSEQIQIDPKYVKRIEPQIKKPKSKPSSLHQSESSDHSSDSTNIAAIDNTMNPNISKQTLNKTHTKKASISSSDISSSTNSTEHPLSLENIELEWKRIIGDSDAKTMELDAAEFCDCWTLNDCDQCKRILFCLKYYKLWMTHKRKQEYRRYKNKNISKRTNTEKILYTEFLSEFVDCLCHYSSVQILNDFHHIKNYHLNPSSNEGDTGNPHQTEDLIEYFKKEMAICNYSNCRSYTRNNRDREQCATSNEYRRNLYFIDEDKLENARKRRQKNRDKTRNKEEINSLNDMNKDGDDEKELHDLEIKETNIQQLFDMIHCTFLHIKTNVNQVSNKFVTDISADGHIEKRTKQKVKRSKTPKISDGISKKSIMSNGSDGDSQFDTDSEDEKEEEKEKEEIMVIHSYGFGEQFKYHDTKHSRYIKPKYKTLKEEILNNTIYRLSEFDYASLTVKASQYLSSYKGRSMIAAKRSGFNELCGIAPNNKITLDHIISLMLYTNYDNLQREFKKGCREINQSETWKEVSTRNREIANWCRCLWEAIIFFGDRVKEKQVFFHGLSCKLLFDSVFAAFNCPTSTTVSKSIAYSFSNEQGIIVQLAKCTDAPQYYMDVSDLSDYPNEQERLFFQAMLGFEDIIYQNKSSKYFIRCLRLFQSITKGLFFSHDNKIFKRKHQKTLIKMMNNLMKYDGIYPTDSNKKINNIPVYMQYLFDHYCKSIKNYGNKLWLNRDEFDKLEENMQNYLNPKPNTIKSPKSAPIDINKYDNMYNDINMSSLSSPDTECMNFTKWLFKKYRTSIEFPVSCNYILENADLDKFWEGKWCKFPRIEYYIDSFKSNNVSSSSSSSELNKIKKRKKKIDDKILLILKIKKNSTSTDNSCLLSCKATELPQYIAKLKCDITLFCPQIKYSLQSTMTISKKPQGIALCSANKLEGMKKFEWRVLIKFKTRIDQNNRIYKI